MPAKKKDTWGPTVALNKAWDRMDSLEARDKRLYKEAAEAAEKMRKRDEELKAKPKK